MRDLLAAAVFGLVLLPGVAAAQQRCHLDDPAPYMDELERRSALPREEAPPRNTPIECRPFSRDETRPEVLTLPMPCGHRMVLRRIDVSVDHILAHREVRFGDVNAAKVSPDYAAQASPWQARLAGGLSVREADGTLKDRAYYMGIYEITEPQWRLYQQGLFTQGVAVFKEDGAACAEHTAWLDETQRAGQVKPAVRMTWFEAMDFARAWTTWLIEIDRILIKGGQKPLMPWEDGTPAFLRLPSEAEWEFAARGGMLDTGREAATRRYYKIVENGETVVPQDVTRIAQIGGGSGDGVQRAGARKPNLLGLHDMLGNAEEMVFDLFRATRADGLHGQRGAVLLRGGSISTAAQNISLGYRREGPLFDTGESIEVRSKYVGARLMLSAPFFVAGTSDATPYPLEPLANTAFTGRLEEATTRLAAQTRQEVATLADIDRRAEEVTDREGLSQLLGEARAYLASVAAERDTAARQAVEQRLISGATSALAMERSGAYVLTIASRLPQIRAIIAKAPADKQAALEDQAARIEAALPGLEQEIDLQFNSYIDNLIALAETDPRILRQGTEGTRARLGQAGLGKLLESFEIQARQLEELASANGNVTDEMKTRWLGEIDRLRDNRKRQR